MPVFYLASLPFVHSWVHDGANSIGGVGGGGVGGGRGGGGGRWVRGRKKIEAVSEYRSCFYTHEAGAKSTSACNNTQANGR